MNTNIKRNKILKKSRIKVVQQAQKRVIKNELFMPRLFVFPVVIRVFVIYSEYEAHLSSFPFRIQSIFDLL